MMIEVTVNPQEVQLEQAQELKLSFRNVGEGPCTNIRFELQTPPEVRVLAGGKPVKFGLLRAKENREHSLRIRAKQTGDYSLVVSFSYRDSSGKSNRPIQKIPIRVIDVPVERIASKDSGSRESLRNAVAQTDPGYDEKSSVSLELIRIRRMITKLFNQEEVRTLCFDLGVDYESLPAEGKAAKVRELVAYCQRSGLLIELTQLCRKERPYANW